jgi:hypothetical protein
VNSCLLSNTAYYTPMILNMAMAVIWFYFFRRNNRILKTHLRMRSGEKLELREDTWLSDLLGKIASRVAKEILQDKSVKWP